MVRESEVRVGDRVQIVNTKAFSLKDDLMNESGEVAGFDCGRIAIRLDNKVGYPHGCDGMVEPGYSVWVTGACLDFDEAYCQDADADFGILGF